MRRFLRNHWYVYKIKVFENSLKICKLYNRYDSDWYHVPTKAQKMFCLMLLRSQKPCILTAAGLYEMKIESFGIVCNNLNQR